MTDRQLAAALAASAASAAAARPAPSMRAALAVDQARHWRWVLHPTSVDLYADGTGTGTSPGMGMGTGVGTGGGAGGGGGGRSGSGSGQVGHAVLLSSGTALHHARIALAASGRSARVELLPKGDGDPAHLATLTAPGEIRVTAEALALYDTLGRTEPGSRRTGPTAPELAEFGAAAAAEGVRLLGLDRDQIVSLAAATSPGAPARDRIARERCDSFAVLYGDDDGPEGWLRAGAALSAIWLLASRRGLVVVPSSAVVQLPRSRAVLRRLLGNRGTPYLALRVGVAADG